MKFKLVSIILLVGLISSGFTCSHKAAITSRGVAASLVALQDSEIALHDQKEITDQEHMVIQEGFIAIAQAGIQVNRCIGAGTGAVCVDSGIAAVQTFINSPVAGIKNPASKAEITLAAQALITSLTVLKGAL